MSLLVYHKLIAVLATVGVGWLAGRVGWLGRGDPARVLGDAALYIFVPALLFRTAVQLDMSALSWPFVASYYAPVAAMLVLVCRAGRLGGAGQRHGVPAPATRAMGVSFGNAVQLGIPLAVALFPPQGLALHLTLVSLHALVLLTLATALVEADLAQADQAGRRAGPMPVLMRTLRDTVMHPVVLPVIAGLSWNLSGLPLPAPVDEALALLGQAVVPVCLVLIGLTLALQSLPRGRHMRAVLAIAALKLVALPAAVLLTAYGLFGLRGLPLAVVVMMAALPSGANALIFAQRYDTLQGEASAAITLSTLLFVFTAPMWLYVLALLEAGVVSP